MQIKFKGVLKEIEASGDMSKLKDFDNKFTGVGVSDVSKIEEIIDGSVVKGGSENLSYQGGGEDKFQYRHNPSDSPKVLLDAVEDTNAVYGYRPNDTGSLKKFVKYDWTDPDVVAKFRENRLRYHIENDGYRELVNSMRADGQCRQLSGLS